MKSKSIIASLAHAFFFLCAALSVLSVVFITYFIIAEGVPLFFASKAGNKVPTIWAFLFGTEWSPTEKPPLYGIFPFIVATMMTTIGALVIAVPIGISAGTYISEVARVRNRNFLLRATEILAGIPSVVYGFIGVMAIGFFLRTSDNPLINYNAFSASLILSIMTLPTIITVTFTSLQAVPDSFREAAYAVGSTKWQMIHSILWPAAGSGILNGIVLGMGRAVGETMAVIMVAGNQPTMPEDGFRSRIRTLTMAIVNDMGYAGDDHRIALFSAAIVLFIFIMTLNAVVAELSRKSKLRGY